MLRTFTGLLLALLLPLGTAPTPAVPAAESPAYTADGALKLPADYRSWVFLTSGLDINYTVDTPAAAGKSVFQNVFVNPASYRAFLATGTWPDKTTMVLELRTAAPKASIDRRGQTQTALRAIEIHVKDDKATPGTWGFYDMATNPTGKLIEHTAGCYTCHEAHAAVDTTFVQFYPTLIDLPATKAHLSPNYLKEIATPAAPATAPAPAAAPAANPAPAAK